MLKIELKRAFKRKSFLYALLIGTLISIVEYIGFNYNYIIMPYRNYLHFFDDYILSGIASPYEFFIIFDPTALANLFFIIMPILVAISYSDSYLEDLNSGFLKNILARCSKRKYLLNKFLANFIISGITISIPLIIDLVMILTTQANIYPDKVVNPSGYGGIFINLYLNNPLLFTLMWIFIYFMFAGVISSITLGFSGVIRNKFIVLVAPFITINAIEILFSLIGIRDYSCVEFLYGCYKVNPIAMLISFIVMLLATFLSFYFGGKSNEIF